MRRPVLIIIIMAVSFFLSDIHSSNVIKSIMFPLLLAAASLVLCLWVIRQFQPNQSGNKTAINDSNSLLISGKNNPLETGEKAGDGSES